MYSQITARALLLGLALLFPLVLAESNVQGQGREASFQSYNFPQRFIRHRQWLGYIEDVRREPTRLRKDAHFRVVPGLAGRCSSFESMNYPGHYLRHQNFRLRISKWTDQQLFKDDATFCMKSGMAYSQGDWKSFESVNVPNHYIRHRNFELWLDRFDNSRQFRADATFQITMPIGGPID